MRIQSLLVQKASLDVERLSTQVAKRVDLFSLVGRFLQNVFEKIEIFRKFAGLLGVLQVQLLAVVVALVRKEETQNALVPHIPLSETRVV